MLERLSKKYQLYIFTAASSEYANLVLPLVDPNHRIKAVLYREHCLETKAGFFIKDLRIIQNRNLEEIALVDNLSHSFMQISNGIPVLSWFGQKNDQELKYLTTYLEEISNNDDFQKINEQYFNLNQLVSHQLPSHFFK